MKCPAKIRPMWAINDTELQCERDADHLDDIHRSLLHDYAYPGSETLVTWYGSDRRNFTGEFSGCPATLGCTLPANHRGKCAL